MVEMGFPAQGMEATFLFVVSDIERSRSFYRDVLGAEVYREYGGTSVVLRFLGTWLLLVTGGGPTEDKPTVTSLHRPTPTGSAGKSRSGCLTAGAPTRS
jgi:catechol 2,3-dioxygenase-like lactoylglutathione lyase family enzyme